MSFASTTFILSPWNSRKHPSPLRVDTRGDSHGLLTNAPPTAIFIRHMPSRAPGVCATSNPVDEFVLGQGASKFRLTKMKKLPHSSSVSSARLTRARIREASRTSVKSTHRATRQSPRPASPQTGGLLQPRYPCPVSASSVRGFCR